jgi:RHS repeat-associated protein
VRDFFAVPVSGDARGRARLVRIRTRIGEEQRLTYGGDGLLEAVVDAAGRSLRFEYDRAGRLARVHVVGTDGSVELVAAFTYDASGDLIEARDALGQSYRYEYVAHLLVKETNRNGLAFYFQYDGVDSTAKCIRTWGDGGIYDHVITYTPDKKKTLVENSLGHVTLYEMNERGQVVSIMNPVGATTKFEYDGDTGWKVAETDPMGAETRHEYDERGHLTKTIRPDGGEVAVEYDVAKQPIHAVDPVGGDWSWSYDTAGRLLGRANPNAERTQFHWDGPRLIAVTDPAGQEARLAYDAAGDLVSLTTPDGATSRWSYDSFGRLRTDTDVNGNVRRRHRDQLGRVQVIEEPDGNRRSLTYDGEGNVIHAVDRHQDVRFEYGGMNRLVARTEAGTRVEFHYDTEDRLRVIKNEHGSAYRFVLDAAGYVAEEYGFDGLRRRYVRDPAGRVSLAARPEGLTTAYAYDAAGRLISVAHSDGTAESYAYRKDDVLVAARNDSIDVLFECDPVGRTTKELQGAEWVSSAYDALGARREVRSSKGLFQRIRRNATSEVTSVDATTSGVAPQSGGAQSDSSAALAGQASFSAAFTRDRMGLEIERALPGGIRALWRRDTLGRPLEQQVSRGGQNVGARQYTWDVGDRLKRVIDAFTGPIEYSHDVFGNLEAATGGDGHVELRVPDAVGNLFRTRDRSDRLYGPAGQLLEARGERGVTRYEYDAEGNLAKKLEADGAVWKYRWNASGMLTEVERPDGKRVTFEYDAIGRRVSKSYRGKTTRFVWDGNVPLHEWVERGPDAEDDEQPAQTTHYDGEKALQALLVGRPAIGPPDVVDATKTSAAAKRGTSEAPVTWLFHPESFAPLAKIVDGESYGFVTDHLGTPRGMYDSGGDEVWSADVDIYGALRDVHGERSACPFRWPGQYEDAETGLYYNRFRYYDPDAGEYISQDPIRLLGGRAFHSYVLDPLAWLDPLGLSSGAGRDHVTYRGIKGGKPYTGYASAPSGEGLTPQEIVGRRYGNDFSEFGGRSPVPVYSGSGVEGKATARGLEQHYFEEDVAKFGREGVANRQNPVGSLNPRAEEYEDAAAAHLGCKG